jgi:hypothetical protein
MNAIEVSLDIWRFAGLYQRMPGLSRHNRTLVRDWALLTAAAVMGAQTKATAPRIGRNEAELLVEGLIQALEAAGIDRVDVAAMFNRSVRSLGPMVPVATPAASVPSGHLLVHEDALRRLAGGESESA